MDTRSLNYWIKTARETFTSPWDTAPIHSFAGEVVPPFIHGPLGWLLKSDINSTWAAWYISGVVDTASFEKDATLSFAHFYKEVLDALLRDHSTAPVDEVSQLARTISITAWREIEFRQIIARQRIPRRIREELWHSESKPRCYLCGYLFSRIARDKYLRVPNSPDIRPAPAVDFIRPRGLKAVELLPQVDHVRPVAIGGETALDNLRLACGWCNSRKSSHIEIYAAPSAYAGTFTHSVLGTVSVPRPLWVVRLTKMRGRCESSSGCTARVESAELFVAPRRLSGAINPTNCAVYCSEHDPWKNERFVGSAAYEQRFQKSNV